MAFWNRDYLSKKERLEIQEQELIKMKTELVEYLQQQWSLATSEIDLSMHTFDLFDFVDREKLKVWKASNYLTFAKYPEERIKEINEEKYIRSIESYKEYLNRENRGNVGVSKTIPLSNIKYFKHDGQVKTETKISGGGGGGSSLSGAVVGGIVAGGVGAVIGSRKKVEPLKSETRTWDMRRVELHYIDENGTDKDLDFTPSAYEVFMELIPEKQYDYVMQQKLPKEQTTEAKSTKEKLTELKELLDEGLITQEEYEKKRQLILENL